MAPTTAPTEALRAVTVLPGTLRNVASRSITDPTGQISVNAEDVADNWKSEATLLRAGRAQTYAGSTPMDVSVCTAASPAQAVVNPVNATETVLVVPCAGIDQT
jgi:hypothetical protein